MVSGKFLPLPYFFISSDWKILDYSRAASSIFLIGDDFNSLVDEGNRQKVSQYIQPHLSEIHFELNMKTKHDPLAVFKISVQWEADRAHIICVEKTKEVDQLASQLMKLRSRLSETDFELLEKKEELEDAINRIYKLSGPFIPLYKESGLIPLFGDLQADKLEVMEANILAKIDEGEYEQVFFDFHGVGEITIAGKEKLGQLFESIQLMGTKTIIVGLSPSQVQGFGSKGTLQADTMGSLQQAISMYVKKAEL
ncbi:STAS domain-containing protein [Terribacillus sp. DMT04]|uniref:STAS domain-containing protein n=1 Tax=Terribacillus sp. DMT04 TaxID=2850441 RepID=UPI001C2BE73D|nr:STAS domain-containing protein [Terribacillus sp. DMT04]QXE02125.1 STAS domain-containing protein [Terribacillus sp. DMT04]